MALMLIGSTLISPALMSHCISDLYLLLPMGHQFISQKSGNHPKFLYISNPLYPSHKDLFILPVKDFLKSIPTSPPVLPLTSSGNHHRVLPGVYEMPPNWPSNSHCVSFQPEKVREKAHLSLSFFFF